jgi:hypothetical protein
MLHDDQFIGQQINRFEVRKPHGRDGISLNSDDFQLNACPGDFRAVP